MELLCDYLKYWQQACYVNDATEFHTELELNIKY